MKTLAKKVDNANDITTINEENFLNYYYAEIGRGYEISIITGGYQAVDGLMEVALYKNDELIFDPKPLIIEKIDKDALNDLIDTSRERPNMTEQIFKLEMDKA